MKRKSTLSLVALTGAAAIGSLLPANPEPAVFESFEYTGRDAIFESPPAENHFQNPILSGFYPDPSICRVGDDFYMVHSTFTFFPGVPIMHSRDLVNWRKIGYALDRPSQLEVDGRSISQGIFAPVIRHHEGVFYMLTTAVWGINNFYVTATNPAGPWSDPKLLPFIDGIDPDFFFDDDGKTYVVHNGPPPNGESLYEGHRAVWLWEVDLETNQAVGEGRIIINGGVDLSKKPVWIEAPHIIKKDGWYYLTCAEGGTSVNHSQVVFRSPSMDGEWVPWENNPILTQRDLPRDRANPIEAAGHADFVQLPNGDWWAIFLAVRPYEGGYYNTGRETFLLPVTWEDGEWPMILESGLEIPWQLEKPDLPKWNEEVAPMTGNFEWSDDFDQPELDLAWNFLRAPKGNWVRIDAEAKQLIIKPQTVSLASTENPSWLARRVHHSTYDVETTLLAPEQSVAAGLAALIREDHYYYVGVRYVDTQYEAFLEKAEGGPAEQIAAIPLPGIEAGDSLKLRIEADKESISFYVEPSNGDRMAVAENEDGRILTTTVAWGFIGTMIGPYARLELE